MSESPLMRQAREEVSAMQRLHDRAKAAEAALDEARKQHRAQMGRALALASSAIVMAHGMAHGHPRAPDDREQVGAMLRALTALRSTHKRGGNG